MFLMIATRPDLAFAVSKLSQFLASPTTTHLTAATRTLRYVKETKSLELTFGSCTTQLEGFCDADYAMDVDTRRSTTGYVFTLYGGAVSWQSKRQRSVALSTAEAEYMALTEATKEAIWLKNITESMLQQGSTINKTSPITIYEDNQAAIKLANNPVDHKRTKHIQVRYHFTRDAISDGIINLQYHSMDTMIADALTKSLPLPRLRLLRPALGLQ